MDRKSYNDSIQHEQLMKFDVPPAAVERQLVCNLSARGLNTVPPLHTHEKLKGNYWLVYNLN